MSVLPDQNVDTSISSMFYEIRAKWTCKPGSVADNHLSTTSIAAGL